MVKRVHRYSRNGALVSVAGAIASYTFRANGMFDPDFTGGGHQPYGFDQMSSYYSTFEVLSARIDIEVVQGATYPLLSGVNVSTDSSPMSILSADNAIETGLGQAVLTAQQAVTPARTLTATWSAKAKYPDHDPAAFQGSASADPSTVDYFTLWTQTVGNAVATESLYYTAVITYYSMWKDPVTIAGS